MSPTDFEEVQFFNSKHYDEGVDWYFSRFQLDGDSSSDSKYLQNQTRGALVSSKKGGEDFIIFDKSATYFDDPKVPIRAQHLVPEARIVILLVNPADRAYSWYQHMKAHGDPVASSLSFEQVIMLNDNDPKISPSVKALRNRCLHPGYYSQHLNRWLEHYPSRQIIIIDGKWFKYNPIAVMNRLQLLLRVDSPIDYNKYLVFDKHKGFYCQRMDENSNEIKCLGKSKGRKYPPMSREVSSYLNRHYWPHNRQLARVLTDIGQPLPIWLDEAMSAGSSGSVIY